MQPIITKRCLKCDNLRCECECDQQDSKDKEMRMMRYLQNILKTFCLLAVPLFPLGYFLGCCWDSFKAGWLSGVHNIDLTKLKND